MLSGENLWTYISLSQLNIAAQTDRQKEGNNHFSISFPSTHSPVSPVEVISQSFAMEEDWLAGWGNRTTFLPPSYPDSGGEVG